MNNRFNLTKQDAAYILATAEPGEDWVDRAAKWEEFGCVWDGDAADLYNEAYRIIHPHYVFGLCAGRHDIPVKEYIFDEIVNPTDRIGMYKIANDKIPSDAESIDLYITGLTPAAMAVVSVCAKRKIKLTAWHYNRETGKYYSQYVLS